MSDGARYEFTASGFFVLRTPLLPFDEMVSWGAGLEARGALGDSDRLEPALARDRFTLREKLAALLAREEVDEAIFVASPGLHSRLEHWAHTPESKKGQRAERALVRYFLRMCGRPTPFGLFAGASVGKIGPSTRLVLAPRAKYRRHSRLDMDYVFALTETLGGNHEIRMELIYRPNSSLYQSGEQFHYAEARLEGKTRSYHLVAVKAEDYLEATLVRAANGATLESLAVALASEDDEIALEEALEFTHELVDSQILVSDLTPPPTGDEATQVLLADMGALNPRPQEADRLEQVRDRIKELDRHGLGNRPSQYRAIAETLEDLPAKPDLSRLFQVDLFKPATAAVLGKEVVKELSRGVRILHRLSKPDSQNLFTHFIEEFRERFEDREVPISTVLDEETGIGFLKESGIVAENAPLLEGIDFSAPTGDETSWKSQHAFLLGKLEEAYRAGSDEIVLQEADLAALEDDSRLPVPDSFEVTATLVAESAEAVNRGEFRLFLVQGSGPSGARLMGRFCHGDPRLATWVKRHLREEEALRPDAVFAEVVHLPEGRLGNILARPVLREYEIPFLGRSSVPADRQIPISDLLVSVRAGRIVLRSARLGREVLPRLSNAHNYSSRSLGIYRFLCFLQLQGTLPNLRWDWGPLALARYLPRVVCGRAVLCCARWILSRDEIDTVARDREIDRFRAMQELRKKRRLPRYVFLADADNRLPIDLDNVLAVESLIDLLRKRGAAILEELLPGPDELCVDGPEGRFAHEIQVPFVRRSTAVPAARGPAIAAPAPFRHRFAPGSEWLYAKIYCGGSTADTILRETVPPIVGRALQSGAARSWFFIRYGDPDPHLRLRFEGEPGRLLGETLPALEQALGARIEDGRIAKLQLDTYTREVDRYGGAEGMLIAEQAFRADSEAVVEMLGLLAGDAWAAARWRLGLRGIDQLLRDFGFDLEGRRDLVSSLREGYGVEFRAGKAMRVQLGNRFRAERKSIEALLEPAGGGSGPYAAAAEVLRRRSERLRPLLARVRRYAEDGRLTRSLPDLASSYVHMFANRLVRSAQRAHELVLYDFLLRAYEARLARARVRARAREGERLHG